MQSGFWRQMNSRKVPGRRRNHNSTVAVWGQHDALTSKGAPPVGGRQFAYQTHQQQPQPFAWRGQDEARMRPHLGHGAHEGARALGTRMWTP